MMRILVCLLLLLIVGAQTIGAQASAAEPQVTGGVEGILAAFDQYPIVAIGDVRNVQQLGDFYSSLIRNPDFATKVGNIVLDVGNAQHQDVVDRYLAGEEISNEELQGIWTFNMDFGSISGPTTGIMYQQLLTTIREVNQTLPVDQRIRVLLGNPPLDPSVVQGGSPPNSNEYFANVVTSEILSQGEKALLIIDSLRLLPDGFPIGAFGPPGGPNMQGSEGGGLILVTPPAGGVGGEQLSFAATPPAGGDNNQQLPPPTGPGQNVRQILQTSYPGQVYTVMMHKGMAEEACNTELEGRLASWTVPSLANVAGTWLEEIIDRPDCHITGDEMLPDFDESWADAYLYLGPISALVMTPSSPDQPVQTYLEWIEEFGSGGDFSLQSHP